MTLTIALYGAVLCQEKRPAEAPTHRPAHAAMTASMPQPQSVDYGDGWLPVTGSFRVEWLGYRDSLLDQAVLRFQNDVARRTGLDNARTNAAPFRIDCPGEDKGCLTIDAKEHYSLTVKNDGVVLTADGPAGVLRGLATLRQSITNGPAGFGITVMAIDDAPRFVWRGVMIDVARHFISLPTFKRQIDAMELVKLNVLHLHLSDNEGFRVESRVYPKLHERSSQEFYSQTEIHELASYAADRGVRIVPEFDVPGHSMAILRAYPEFASGEVENRDTFRRWDRRSIRPGQRPTPSSVACSGRWPPCSRTSISTSAATRSPARTGRPIRRHIGPEDGSYVIEIPPRVLTLMAAIGEETMEELAKPHTAGAVPDLRDRGRGHNGDKNNPSPNTDR
jgi:hypothetical protein